MRGSIGKKMVHVYRSTCVEKTSKLEPDEQSHGLNIERTGSILTPLQLETRVCGQDYLDPVLGGFRGL